MGKGNEQAIPEGQLQKKMESTLLVIITGSYNHEIPLSICGIDKN